MMAVIGYEYTDLKRKHSPNTETVVKNVPLKVLDQPCWQGCCKNEKVMSTRDSYRASWLNKYYLPDKGLTEFDYRDDWNQEVEQAFDKWLESRKSNR